MADIFQKYARCQIFNLLCVLLLTSYSRILRSDFFTFLVGKDRKAVIVHLGAITEHSKALSALVNNGMAESQTRSATLDDADEDDIIRFCQFAYTGDYSIPPFTEDEIPSIKDKQIPIEDGEEWATASRTKKGKKGKKLKARKHRKSGHHGE